MESSDTATEVWKAIVAVQSERALVKHDANNPHFRSRYATLGAVLSAVLPTLTEHGCCIVQPVSVSDDAIRVETRIVHAESGQWVATELTAAPDRKGIQAAGSTISYLRRYSVLSLLGLATADDDGETAARQQPQRDAKPKAPKPSWGESQLKAATDKGYSADHLRLFIGGHPSHWTKDDHLGAFQYFVKRSKLGQVAAVLPSNSDPNRRYIIVDTGAGLSCDCEAGKHKKPCKHVDAFVASLERE